MLATRMLNAKQRDNNRMRKGYCARTISHESLQTDAFALYWVREVSISVEEVAGFDDDNIDDGKGVAKGLNIHSLVRSAFQQSL